MPLDKQVIDIPIIAGLEQKWDPRLAPLGVSLTAKNLVKTKRNALRKRLGFTSLGNGGGTYINNVGLNLGTHQDKLVIFGQSHARSNGQKVNTASVYSDGLATIQPISCVPEVLVKPKTYSVPVDGLAFETDTVAFGNYLITVWSANPSPNLSSTGAAVYYNVIESDSGNLILNGTVDAAGSNPRVFVVGGSQPVVTYLSGAQVYGQILNTTTLIFGNKATLATVEGFYDADAIGGRSLFSLVYKINGTITVSTNSISSNIFVSQGTATVTDNNKPAGTTVDGYGLVGDNPSGYIVVAFSYQDNSGNTTVDAAAVSLSNLNANVTAATLWSTASTGGMKPPKAIAVVDLGIIGGAQSWGLAWGCPYANLTKTGYNAGAEPYTFFTSVVLNAGVPETTPGSVFPSSTFGVVPVSRFVAYNGIFYIVCFVPSKYQGGYYLCSVDQATLPFDAGYFPLRPVATIAPRQALCDGTISANFPLNATIGSTLALTHVTFTSTNSQYANAALSVMTTPIGSKTVPSIYQLEFNSRHLYRSAQLGPCLVHASGMPSSFDGAASVEIGFPYYPEVPNPKTAIGSPAIQQIQYANWAGTPGGGSSGTASAGPYFASSTDTYNWIFTYEWVDAQSQTHISGRSPVVTITGADVQAAGLTLPTTVNVIFRVPSSGIGYRVLNRGGASDGAQSLGGQASKVTIGMYRNTQASPATYQRVGDPQNISTTDGLGSYGGSYNSSIYNGPSGYSSAGYASYVMMIDASYDQATGTASGTPNIASNALLYNDGSDGTTGNLDNLNGPSSSVLVQHKNRIFIADGNQVWFTKVYTPGEGPGFNESAMMFPVGDSSPITGLASMDDKLVIFKRKSIYYVSGEGPEDNGQNGEFGEPIPVPTEIGCEDGRSIVTTPEGVYFYSDAGLRLLDRSLTVQYVGVSIEDEVSTYPYITSAVLHPNTNRMIVCANTNDTDTSLTGEFLYRDYSLDAWTTGQLAAAGGGNGGPIAAGIGIAPYTYGEEPVLHLLTADGYVWRENDIAGAGTVYEDDGYFVPSTLKMSWLKPAQSIEGFGRIWRVNLLADMLDPAQLTVSVYTDYDSTTASNTATWNPTDLSQTSPAFPQVVVKNQRCSAISVTITDAAPTDGSTVVSGQGWNLLGLALEAGVYPGGRRAASGDRK